MNCSAPQWIISSYSTAKYSPNIKVHTSMQSNKTICVFWSEPNCANLHAVWLTKIRINFVRNNPLRPNFVLVGCHSVLRNLSNLFRSFPYIGSQAQIFQKFFQKIYQLVRALIRKILYKFNYVCGDKDG